MKGTSASRMGGTQAQRALEVDTVRCALAIPGGVSLSHSVALIKDRAKDIAEDEAGSTTVWQDGGCPDLYCALQLARRDADWFEFVLGLTNEAFGPTGAVVDLLEQRVHAQVGRRQNAVGPVATPTKVE
eukprot:2067886-Prymnesium_polylepis.1